MKYLKTTLIILAFHTCLFSQKLAVLDSIGSKVDQYIKSDIALNDYKKPADGSIMGHKNILIWKNELMIAVYVTENEKYADTVFNGILGGMNIWYDEEIVHNNLDKCLYWGDSSLPSQSSTYLALRKNIVFNITSFRSLELSKECAEIIINVLVRHEK